MRFPLLAFLFLYAMSAHADDWSNEPWKRPEVPIVLDPYGPNELDFDKAVGDHRLKAIIHQATKGLGTDSKFAERQGEAKKHHLLWGAYHFGLPGDPEAQAKHFLDVAGDTKFLALDIDGVDPTKYMSFEDAETFVKYVYQQTGRYVAIYTNISTMAALASRYGESSVFFHTALWIAYPGKSLRLPRNRISTTYLIWQFSDELNCGPKIPSPCLYKVPGTKSDMDINVFPGSEADIKSLFEH